MWAGSTRWRPTRASDHPERAGLGDRTVAVENAAVIVRIGRGAVQKSRQPGLEGVPGLTPAVLAAGGHRTRAGDGGVRTEMRRQPAAVSAPMDHLVQAGCHHAIAQAGVIRVMAPLAEQALVEGDGGRAGRQEATSRRALQGRDQQDRVALRTERVPGAVLVEP